MLKLPLVAKVVPCCWQMASTIPLTEVLPQLPVNPTIGIGFKRRQKAANSPNAIVVSATCKKEIFFSISFSGPREARITFAPWVIACAIKS